jgi:hypothetical protein
MEFTPQIIQEDGNRITTTTGDFFAVRTVGTGWSIYYCGQTHTGQLIGHVIDGKFHFNAPDCNIFIDIDRDAIQLVCLLLHCQLEDDKRGSDTN